eukprot:m.45513 g.45513  ORF g.45513 m.45513 type:complete len:396 (+) comp19992_c0_seq1:268-1455(+)
MRLPLNLTTLLPLVTLTSALVVGVDVKVEVGAIRWDAWYGDADMTGEYVEEALAPAKWRYRLPFFAKEINSTTVDTNGSSITTMKQELVYAFDYNISFWAFVAYAPTTNLFYAQRNYLTVMENEWGTTNTPVKFCLILDGNGFTMLSHGTTYFVDYFKRPYYQTVLIDGMARPLLFTFGQNTTARGPGSPFACLLSLEAACESSGLPKPYVVAMDFGAVRAQAQAMKQLGADAVSTYAYINFSYYSPPYQGVGLPYDINSKGELANVVAAAKSSPAVDVVPTITAGWDPRPREVNSPPWQHAPSPPGCNVSGEALCFIQDPTMNQLKNHTRDVVLFARQHSGSAGAARARVVLVSAWNEHDEGHWVCPSLHGEPTQTAKLEAIKQGIIEAHTVQV